MAILEYSATGKRYAAALQVICNRYSEEGVKFRVVEMGFRKQWITITGPAGALTWVEREVEAFQDRQVKLYSYEYSRQLQKRFQELVDECFPGQVKVKRLVFSKRGEVSLPMDGPTRRYFDRKLQNAGLVSTLIEK